MPIPERVEVGVAAWQLWLTLKRSRSTGGENLVATRSSSGRCASSRSPRRGPSTGS